MDRIKTYILSPQLVLPTIDISGRSLLLHEGSRNINQYRHREQALGSHEVVEEEVNKLSRDCCSKSLVLEFS